MMDRTNIITFFVFCFFFLVEKLVQSIRAIGPGSYGPANFGLQNLDMLTFYRYHISIWLHRELAYIWTLNCSNKLSWEATRAQKKKSGPLLPTLPYIDLKLKLSHKFTIFTLFILCLCVFVLLEMPYRTPILKSQVKNKTKTKFVIIAPFSNFILYTRAYMLV